MIQGVCLAFILTSIGCAGHKSLPSSLVQLSSSSIPSTPVPITPPPSKKVKSKHPSFYLNVKSLAPTPSLPEDTFMSWASRLYRLVVSSLFIAFYIVLLLGGFWISRQTTWDEDIQKGIDWGYRKVPKLPAKRSKKTKKKS